MKDKIYCLWGSCRKFNLDKPNLCSHNDYVATGKPVCLMSLEEAKSKYPDTAFCEDWEPEKENQIK